jgi:hypothetical protein
MFGESEIRYRDLQKSLERIHLPLGFTNLLIGDRHELARPPESSA